MLAVNILHVAFAGSFASASGGVTSNVGDCLLQLNPKNGTLDISPCLVETTSLELLLHLDSSLRATAIHNTLVLNQTFARLYELVPAEPRSLRRTIVLRNSASDGRFLMQGGVSGEKLDNLTLQIDGVLDFGGCIPIDSAHCRLAMRDYPGFSFDQSKANTPPMIQFVSPMRNLKITSTGVGRLVGGGEQWYGAIKKLSLGDTTGRTEPVMLRMTGGSGIIDGLELENLSFEQAAYWTTYLMASNVKIHHCNVTSRVLSPELPKPFGKASDVLEELWRINAWNTDGFDIIGDNVHIHDCVIQTSDDCVAVKGGSNWLVERIVATGAGLTIGSGGSAKNITFRDIVMPRTIHGLYIKTSATDVLYENVTIIDTILFPIWIGPPWQELDGACPLTFPFISAAAADGLSKLTHHQIGALCRPRPGMRVHNLTFRDIRISTSRTTPIVLFGGDEPFDVTFDNVSVDGDLPTGDFPFGSRAACYNVTVKPVSLTQPGQLLQECAPSAPVCIAAGSPRGALTPCCNESGWSPHGAWWGMCV